MKPPKCRLCGHEHYGMAHVFATETVTPVANQRSEQVRPKADAGSPRSVKAERSAPTDVATRPTESARVQKWREANRDRYNERERERMRKVRAKKPLGIAYG